MSNQRNWESKQVEDVHCQGEKLKSKTKKLGII